ncbi:hypothetical protein KGP45_09925 [Pediococcus ethanolidurans]|uniref:hypothetical protein n=1 Tax=Pediococcus ethanolidurans TaxID=319653 RepID=UPI001C1ECEC8|nr:hypothetical protein [Pediococcus ethanolidurans]MBU7564417.1 hypothetical protein [Pediococcus ethanolidurans]
MTIKIRKVTNSKTFASLKVRKKVDFVPVLNDKNVILIRRNIFSKDPKINIKKFLKQMNLEDNGSMIGKENVW